MSCLLPNVYLVYTSCNFFSHFEPVCLVPVRQTQAGCRICNPASPVTSRWPADVGCPVLPAMQSHRFTCRPSAWQTRASTGSAALQQSRGDPAGLLLWAGTCRQSHFSATSQLSEGLRHSREFPTRPGISPGTRQRQPVRALKEGFANRRPSCRPLALQLQFGRSPRGARVLPPGDGDTE